MSLALALLAALPLAVQEGEPEAPPLSVDDLRAAGRVVGLEFTDAELELMLPDVSDRLRQYERLRAPSLDNAVLPAQVFTPWLPGMERRVVGGRVLRAAGGRLERPDDLEEVVFWSLHDQGRLLRQGEVSCVELAELYLDRLERIDAELRCVITYTRERALAQAAERDAELARGEWRGPLHGIPWGVKDLMAVEGYPTTWGAAPYREQVLAGTAEVVRRLDEAGAVLVAKLSVGALAMGDRWFDARTNSPWDPRRGSSGSSAGSAAATAAGGVGFSLGTETLGSIVSPSVVCATTALRPTFGRVPRTGTMTLSWTMDKVGPICRRASDCRLVFEAIRGADPADPFSRDVEPMPLPEEDPVVGDEFGRSLRIGVPEGAFARARGLREAVEQLEAMGHTTVEVELPDHPVGAMMITLMAEAATSFDELTRGGLDDLLVRQTRGAWPNAFRAARFIPAVEYLRAQRMRTQLCLDVHAALAEVDVLVHAPYAAGILRTTNLTGHPTLCVPFVPSDGPREDGAPRLLCFTGQLDADELLLRLGEAFQAAHPEHVLHPPMPWLAEVEPEGSGR